MTAPNNKLPKVLEQHSYMPSNFTEAMQFCEFLSKSDFVPKQYKGRPGDIMACAQFGAERGIPPMQALQNIAVINGRPSMYGDLLLAMVQRTGLMTHHKEYFKKAADGSTVSAVCEVRRRDDPDIHIVEFSVNDAKDAGLLGKAGPWTQYPKRMLMWRARGFALRDKFADALGGLISREEAMDMPADEPKRAAPLEPEPHIECGEPKDSLSHDSQHENPVHASADGSETAAVTVGGQDEEGPEDGSDASTAPLAGGGDDFPSIDQVKDLFRNCKKPHPVKIEAIRGVVMDWDTRGGVEKLTPQERQHVVQALNRL